MATTCVMIKSRSFNPLVAYVIRGRASLPGGLFFKSQAVTKRLRHHIGGALLFRRGLIEKRAKLNEPRNGRNHEKG